MHIGELLPDRTPEGGRPQVRVLTGELLRDSNARLPLINRENKDKIKGCGQECPRDAAAEEFKLEKRSLGGCCDER